jgi:hypothetical protein
MSLYPRQTVDSAFVLCIAKGVEDLLVYCVKDVIHELLKLSVSRSCSP